MTVWDDRFLFVIAALAAMAYTMLKHHRADSKYLLHVGRRTMRVSKWVAAAIALLLAVVGFRVWLYWPNLETPDVRSAITLLLGAVVGAFMAKAVQSLLGSEFGSRELLVGAAFSPCCALYTACRSILMSSRIFLVE